MSGPSPEPGWGGDEAVGAAGAEASPIPDTGLPCHPASGSDEVRRQDVEVGVGQGVFSAPPAPLPEAGTSTGRLLTRPPAVRWLKARPQAARDSGNSRPIRGTAYRSDRETRPWRR